jgi:hypothetical protein
LIDERNKSFDAYNKLFLKSFVGKLFPPSQNQAAALIRAPSQESAERISESLGFSVLDCETELLPSIAEHSNLRKEEL